MSTASNQVLEWIQQLYDIEDRALDSTAAELQALRQLESVPVLDRIESDLDDLSRQNLTKSTLGKAVTYARNQRAAFRQYVSDGWLTIDNNVSERTVRPKPLEGRTGSSSGVPRRDHERQCCSRFWREPSVIAWNRGRMFETSCCA